MHTAEGSTLYADQPAADVSVVRQAYPLITTIVGMVVFKEFKGAAKSTQDLLAAMFSFYLAAVALIASSAQIRPAQA